MPFDPANCKTYKINTNSKINILMSENIGKRRLSFTGKFQCFILSLFSNFQSNKNVDIKIYQKSIKIYQKSLISFVDIFRHKDVSLDIRHTMNL